MTVFRDRNRWRAQFNGVSLGSHATQREARKAVADYIAAGKRAPSPMTIAEFRDVWLAKKATEIRASTLTHYTERTAELARTHGRRAIVDWTPLDSAAWYADHPGQLDEIKRMFRAAVDLEVIERDPWRAFKKRSGKRQLASGWVTIADVSKLAAAARDVGGPGVGDLMAAMILTSAWTGIRPGELFALEPGDVNYENGDLQVQRSVTRDGTVDLTKSGEERTVVIPPPALDAIKATLPLRAKLWPGQDPRPLFPNQTGNHWRGPAWSYWWKSIKAKAGTGIGDHYELRHLAATQLLEAGVSVEDVAHQLGHRDGGRLVSAVYGHPDERFARDRIRRAMEGLEERRLAS